MKTAIALLSFTLLSLPGLASATGGPPLMLAQAEVAPLVSGQRVRVKKLTRDMNQNRQDIVTTGPSQFQDASVVKARQKRLKQFEDALNRYPQLDDPDVQAARGAYVALAKALSTEYKRAQAQLAKLGDVQQALATIEENGRKYAVPALPQIPFTEAQAKDWVQAASNARTVAEHNHKELALIAELAYLPNNPGTPQAGAPYDANDVARLQRHAASMFKAVQADYQTLANDLASRMQQMDSDVFSRWQEDPQGEKKWIFLRDNSVKEAHEVFARSRAIAQSSVYLEQALNRPADQALAILEKLDQAEQQFKRNGELALAASRLPQPVANDPARIDIAEQILQTPKYEFGKHGPIVLTTPDIIERERKDSEIDIDDAEITLGGDLKMRGTQTTWTYKWKEFKFAVPLQDTDSERWYIWWITAKNFSSGGDRTPIGRWISGKATKGDPILPQHF
jgi:hypothetical protein